VTRVRARVIGLGQPAAGDDGAGVAVVRALREGGLPRDVEALDSPDPSALVTLLERGVATIVVDAVLGAPAGQVLELTIESLAPRMSRSVSSHGIGLAEALGLAQVLSGADPRDVRIVAITIGRPAGYDGRLSPDVAAAVPCAAAAVLRLLGTGPA
jgi:hydrogenase maturation protease